MTLQIGDRAPDFDLPASHSATGRVRLADYAGRNIVLYFYPKDDTPGCTKEACNFRDGMHDLQQLDAMVLGVSKDSVASHEKFAKKFDLNYPLLADEQGELVQAYEAWVEKSMYGKKYMGIERCTYLVNGEGNIAQIWRNVKVENHFKEVQQALQQLSRAKVA